MQKLLYNRAAPPDHLQLMIIATTALHFSYSDPKALLAPIPSTFTRVISAADPELLFRSFAATSAPVRPRCKLSSRSFSQVQKTCPVQKHSGDHVTSLCRRRSDHQLRQRRFNRPLCEAMADEIFALLFWLVFKQHF